MKKVAVVFPGQGSQYIGMGKHLYDNYERAKKIYEEADSILGYKLSDMIFYGSEEELKETEYTQLAIYITNMAAFTVLMETCQIKPSVMAGHSLGELSALTAAGAFDFKTGVELVRDRAQYMKAAAKKVSGTMYAIRNIHYTTVEEVCNSSKEPGIAVVSNYNAASQTVISGDIDKTRIVADRLDKLGAVITQLKVSGAFHSPLMDTARADMKKRLEELTVRNFDISVIANVNGAFYKKEETEKLLSNQITNAVQWVKTLHIFEKLGINAVVETGPGKVLSNLLEVNNMPMDTYRFEKKEDIKQSIEHLIIHYKSDRPNLLQKCISFAVCTKNYNENPLQYQQGVLIPINELKQMAEECQKREITQEERNLAVSLLRKILITKAVPQEELENRLQAIGEWDESEIISRGIMCD
ncbi:MAG: ACP S-malonyltransferase [Ruminiclostridium sp.]